MPDATSAWTQAPGVEPGRGMHGRALAALMLASFAIGTGEFVIVGLVPGLASDLRVSIPTAGLLISGYALSVAFGSPVIAAILSSAPRRRALLTLMVVFLGGDIACAMAPTFALMMSARIATALAHGAFFGIASVVAGKLAPPGKAVRAVGLLFTGLTVANVFGVPVGTWIGQAAGWRVTFMLVALLAAVSLAAMLIWMPRQLGRGSEGLRHEVATLRKPQIWLAMIVSTLSSAGLFTALSFLTPLLERESGFTAHGAALGLLVFGIGLTAGGLIGGRFPERHSVFAIRTLLTVDALALVVFGLVLRDGRLTFSSIFFWGLAAFALVPPLQQRVVSVAGGSPQLASTLNQSAFNLGDALGAALGAALLARAIDYSWLPGVGAAVIAAALIPALLGHASA